LQHLESAKDESHLHAQPVKNIFMGCRTAARRLQILSGKVPKKMAIEHFVPIRMRCMGLGHGSKI
jgi:hypothetical protein